MFVWFFTGSFFEADYPFIIKLFLAVVKKLFNCLLYVYLQVVPRNSGLFVCSVCGLLISHQLKFTFMLAP